MTPEEYTETPSEPGSEVTENISAAEDSSDIGATPQKRSFRQLEPSAQRILWLVLGVAIVLAVVVPGAYVYTRNSGPTNSDVVIVPVVNKDEPGSIEPTKTVQPGTPKPEEASKKDVLGEEFEDWDYQTLGRNIIAPSKGKRVVDSSGELNPSFESVYLDALDLEIHAAEVAAADALPTVSGRTPASPMPDDGSNPPTTFTAIKLTGIGTSGGSSVAVFLVDGNTFEAGVGDEIDSTGWSVTSMSASTVVISDGTSSRTLVLPNGSK